MTKTSRHLLAAEVRAAMAYQRLSGVKLAALLHKSQSWVARRLDGRVAFDAADLAEIETILDLPRNHFVTNQDRLRRRRPHGADDKPDEAPDEPSLPQRVGRAA